MIVKSMSRKVPSFGQLVSYIDRDEGQDAYRIRHNLFARDPERIRSEFERNGTLLQKRKNGVYLYHEIISITRARHLSAEDQKARLREIAEQYIAARCPDNLVYGGLHQDKEHSFHYHLMISANRASDAKRLRLSKAQFREIQIQLERHVLEKYPELEQKVAIEKRSERSLGKAEAELERRTGQLPKRNEVLERVLAAYGSSSDRDSLLAAFGREGLELYVRGKNLGVVDLESGKKHRLNTLNLETADRVALRMSGEDAAREDPKEREDKDAPTQSRDGAFKKSAGEKEKAPEAQEERGAERQQAERQNTQEATQKKDDEMLGKRYTTTPETPSPERKEKIDRDEITPDPLRDKMTHEDWKRQDSFLYKFKASWMRTMDDFRTAMSPEEEKARDQEAPKRGEGTQAPEPGQAEPSSQQRAWREEIDRSRGQSKGRDDTDRGRD